MGFPAGGISTEYQSASPAPTWEHVPKGVLVIVRSSLNYIKV